MKLRALRSLAVAVPVWLCSLCACGTSGVNAVSSSPDATVDGAEPQGDDGSTPAREASAPGASCGYDDAGVVLHVATGLDLCMPRVACTSEVCPPELGACVNDSCVFKPGYDGVATLPEAWVTYYCSLSSGGCHGVTQIEYPEITAQKIATSTGLPVCDQEDAGSGECVGIAAAPAMIVGNSQEAVDQASQKPVTDWGLGLTEASGLCYEIVGPGGKALVALTDRCGGYCSCKGSGVEECGPCVNAPDLTNQCPCVGTVPPVFTSCCGAGCGGTVNPQCDWCASNNHPHFDLDTGTFNLICGSLANLGSCKLTSVSFVHCLDATGWPPG